MRGCSRALRPRPTASDSVPCCDDADTLYGILPRIDHYPILDTWTPDIFDLYLPLSTLIPLSSPPVQKSKIFLQINDNLTHQA